jgi:nicotinamide-nucleotide amidase
MNFIDTKLLELSQKINNSCPQGYLLSVAESCTGGMISASITAVSGSSRYFCEGIVSYSNEAKHRLLGVTFATLDKFGAVSEETAVEMALGSLKNTNSNLAISVTGIAGPDGGSAKKPVGAVCFALATNNNKTKSYSFVFQGNRSEIRYQSCLKGLELILENIYSISILN